MPEQHAKLSASGSAKWLACPAALGLEEIIDLPYSSSFEADEGTAAHELAALALNENNAPGDYLGGAITVNTYDHEISPEMVENVEVYTSYVRNIEPLNIWIEKRVDYRHIAPFGFGTSDAIIETVERVNRRKVSRLYIVDLKYGKGIKVDAMDNTQGLCYASGALNTLDMFLENIIQEIVIVIVQPRLGHISEWIINVNDLRKWESSVKPKADLAWSLLEKTLQKKANGLYGTALDCHLLPELFNVTEKGCRWCAGRKTQKCKAQAKSGIKAAIEGFEDLTGVKDITADDLTESALLSNQELADIYEKAALFHTWLNSLKDTIIERLKTGEEIPGYTLDRAVKNRAWIHGPEETIKALRTAGLQKKDYEILSLISPAQAEKKLKEIKPTTYKRRYKKLYEAAIHRPEGDHIIIKTPYDVTQGFENMDFLN